MLFSFVCFGDVVMWCNMFLLMKFGVIVLCLVLVVNQFLL